MTQNKNQNIFFDMNNLYGYAMSKFFSNNWIQMDRS